MNSLGPSDVCDGHAPRGSAHLCPPAWGLLGFVCLLGCARSTPPRNTTNQHSSIHTEALVSWLDQTLIELEGDHGFERVADVIGAHDVVAAGEATHGTKQFFEAKGRLFQLLVERHGFRTLAMEMDSRAGGAVDEFLQTGRGDLDQLVQGSYFFFEAREIVALLGWMRHRNETSADKVHFVGIDVQNSQQRLIDERCGGRPGCRVVLRDGFMAENVLALGRGTFVWAHNGHVGHFAAPDGWRPMGQYLRAQLGAKYFAIAMEFSEGGFVAPAGGALPIRRRRVLTHLRDREVAEYVVPAAPPEAISHLLVQARVGSYFVDLRPADAASKEVFHLNRKLQSYGAIAPGPTRQFEEYAPLHQTFDGLVFIASTDGYTFPTEAR